MPEQPNPFLDEKGYPLPGKSREAFAFAKTAYQQYLDSLTPVQREEVNRQHQNFIDHMNVAV